MPVSRRRSDRNYMNWARKALLARWDDAVDPDTHIRVAVKNFMLSYVYRYARRHLSYPR